MNAPDTVHVVDHFALSAEQRAVAPGSGAPGQGCDTGAGDAIVLTIAIGGPLVLPRLRAAVRALALRHTQLCARFSTVEGYRGLRQWIVPPEAAGWDLAEAPVGPATAAGTPAGSSAAQVVLHALAEDRWRLAWRLPALVADRRSAEILYRDLVRAYAGLADEQPLQYAEFAAWRRDLEQGEDGDAGRAYWSDLARHAPLHLSYRAAAAAAADDRQPPGVERHDLDTSVSASLVRVAAAHAVAVPVLLQAAWWALLALIQGHGEFAAGWRHDCRRDYEVMDGAVGVFEKILPLAITLTLDEPFHQWLARCAQMLAQHVAAQEFAPLAAAGTIAAGAGFACGDLPPAVTDGGVTFACGALPDGALRFELELLVEFDGAQPRRLNLRHAPCYGAAAVARLLQQLVTLLAALERDQALPIDRLPVVGAAERAALLALAAETIDIGERMLPQRLADWARATPGAPALQARDLALDYRQLDQRVNRLAHWLRAQGVSSGSIVALALPRSGALVVTLLAVLRAGAAYLPLDPDWPQARVAAILDDARPALLLTPAEDGQRGAVRCVSLAALAPQLAQWPATEPAHLPAADDAAYVLYTSGSTGAPKGVIIEHRQLLNYALAASSGLGLAEAKRFALSSALAADLGNTTLFGALFNGACLVVADTADMQTPADFARFIREGGIDCLKIVPSHLDALLDDESPALPARVILGGEATPRRLLARLHALAPQTLIFNHYGPTETTVGVMTHFHRPGTPAPAVLPLTQVMANCRVLVLDRHGALVPTGALGELYVGGAQLCRSYLNRPGEPFVADPLDPGARLYRTGDLARHLPEGGIELAGRADHQLKLRGYRIEPAEVEAALLALPGMRQAVVAPHGEGGQRRLVAWVVASVPPVPQHQAHVQAQAPQQAPQQAQQQEARDQSAQVAAWLAALRAVLPDVMVPAAIVPLPALPRLGNGKVDLRALPAPGHPVQQPAEAQVAPATALEWLVAHLMGEVLEQPAPGMDDDFFALGGHSLLVIKLVGRIRKALHVEFAPGLVFDHPTPAALARAVAALAGDGAQLEQVADLRRQLAGMTPAARAALLQGAPA
ncbi:hypothetical protein ASF61_07065 [Duganella sp. Leaf126]|uniref:non-ribosomal peptide synthetase family protein n=1 Tax=Duganella sp. Leaf126 TaxID=1736266 RepID=UPI0006F371ED|nr:amino acid adenylation domain-containing protein [Duganella sp. Leaf126]KQQ35972.1 hypothetical protein ASF61_07065 [Duganella sp. Leaf126]